MKPKPDRLFYTGAASAMLLVAFFGFQQFYLHHKTADGTAISPAIHALVMVHAVAMAGWLVLFLVQSALIATGRRQLHLTLGRVGAILAACIAVLGPILAIQSTKLSPDLDMAGLTHRQFLTIPLTDILSFSILLTVGLVFRNKSEIHRPMMLLATLRLLPAATARIPFVAGVFSDQGWIGMFGPILSIGLLLLVIKSVWSRSMDWWYAAGWAGIALSSPLIIWLAHSSAWSRFAHWLVPA